MAAQSGIVPTTQLSNEWSTFLSDSSRSLFKIVIKDEQLQSDGHWSIEGEGEGGDEEVEKVFALFKQEGVTDDKLPAYYVLRLDSTSNSFLFISYVPDHAQVRSKMLYASTRTTLIRSLGDSKFIDSIFATSLDDLSYTSYLAHTRHSSASAPLTAREQEMVDIRQAESQAANDTEQQQQQQGRSIIFGQQGGSVDEEDGGKGKEVRGALPWSEEAKEAVRGLKQEGSKDVVQLEIDLKTESIVLSEPQPDSLSVPSDKPCYLFYRHSAGIVLIYSCPPKSPIKSRLVYSSAVLVFYKYAAKEYAGVEVLKKLETDDPSEITLDWIDSELGSLAGPSNSATGEGEGGSGTSTPGGGSAPMPKEDKGFARPSRPGRRRG